MKGQAFTPEQLLGPLNKVEKKNAPELLYVVGDATVLSRGVRVSIVGSRKASPDGLKRTSKLATRLVERGIIVVSGLAEGIDTSAHRAAMDTGGRTIAVLGTPLETFYPPANRSLQEEIAMKHLVVSQFAPGSTVRPRNFPMRNRTMALLSDATVIVEAGDRSGSLHQGWEALRLGRPLFLMKSVLEPRNLTWPAEMQRYGAEIVSDETLEFLFDVLPEGSRTEAKEIAF